jgi:SAM-dependent methyltransferase
MIPCAVYVGVFDYFRAKDLTSETRSDGRRHERLRRSDVAMIATPSHTRSDPQLLEANRRFYDPLWSDARLVEPERFNTWPLVRSLAAQSRSRLEVAPGLRPRLPIDDTYFLDISAPALARLSERGASVVLGSITSLPFSDGRFDLVCALDILEHVDDDGRALSELSRVTTPGGWLLLSAPLHPMRWSAFDEFVGHRRRYEPARLLAKLAERGFSVESSAVFGMRPRSSRLVDLGMWYLTHWRGWAMWWYNRVIMPLALRYGRELAVVPGIVETEEVDEILLVCRKNGTPVE